jgi:molybdopterin-guanine dinucleotide biosynthesis protein A
LREKLGARYAHNDLDFDEQRYFLYKDESSEPIGFTVKTKTAPGPPPRYEHVTGVILAGGLSTRYGENKALLRFGGVRLIERIAEEMKGIFHQVILVTNQKRDFEYLKLPMVEDLVKGLGPIGGIYTGLSAISEQAGFFVACDMPLLHTGLIRYMVEIINDYEAVVPLVDKWVEPLHAVYTRSCLPTVKALIDKKRYPVRLFYDRVHVRYVTEDEIRQFCSPEEAFLNINTPEEFYRIRHLVKVQKPGTKR